MSLTQPQPVGSAGDLVAPASISVVTAARNADRFIAQAILSVAGQTLPPLEHIVVDDGSDDSTAAVVAGMARPGLRLIRSDHRGAPAARNLGIAEAGGELIALLDADDRWHADFLRRSVAALASAGPDVGCVFTRSRLITARGNQMGRLEPRPGRYEVPDLLLAANPAGNGSCLLLRKSVLDEIGGFDETLASAQDFDLLLRLATSASSSPGIVGIDAELVEYRLTGTGSVSGALATRLGSRARLEALQGILRTYRPHCDEQTWRQAHIRPALFAYTCGNDDVARRLWQEATADGQSGVLSSAEGRKLRTWHLAGRLRPVMRAARAARQTLDVAVADGPKRVLRPLLRRLFPGWTRFNGNWS
ncbi:MAG TPA: glycosyltransferase [Acidimicrobiales bacterium]|nr:glycosyltransferase [Acidimicrobiales bacterium]